MASLDGTSASPSTHFRASEIAPLQRLPTAKPLRRTIRRPELRSIVPLADTTIYELEQRGEFPKRFFLTPRCVVWDLAEVEAWVQDRRQASDSSVDARAQAPNVRLRRVRPVKR